MSVAVTVAGTAAVTVAATVAVTVAVTVAATVAGTVAATVAGSECLQRDAHAAAIGVDQNESAVLVDFDLRSKAVSSNVIK